MSTAVAIALIVAGVFVNCLEKHYEYRERKTAIEAQETPQEDPKLNGRATNS